MAKEFKVLLYLNNAFGGYGFEEAAGMGFDLNEGPKGPGNLLQAQLNKQGEATGDTYKVVATLCAGDDFFSAEPEANSAKAIELLDAYKDADIFFAGPAFAAGRYTVSCGALCEAIGAAWGIPCITGMDEQSPGTDIYRKKCYIIKTGNNAREVPQTVAKMARLGHALLHPDDVVRLTSLEYIPDPREYDYFTRGQLRCTYVDRTVAERSVDMIVKKVNGEEFVSEVYPDRFDTFDIPKAVKDLSKAKIAFVSDGGLVYKGNPDHCQTRSNLVWADYDLRTLMAPGGYEVVHAGYFNDYVNQDPNRLLPLDVIDEDIKAGKLGGISDHYMSMPACTTVSAQCKKNGAEIGEKLKALGDVDAVILTST